jgi:hypothetical protein
VPAPPDSCFLLPIPPLQGRALLALTEGVPAKVSELNLTPDLFRDSKVADESNIIGTFAGERHI